ncbi:serine hydrolase domain-containing protein [Paenibacillus alkalitolerans]|uniref:serine hydrolase domain-containing protein n=1 Tax=Paenibacillus alkalitolerans TaxID=2799335 RepID=UPI0018F5A39A|nr:serine hydrolase [Paenibacillus alkalitolerans]
MNISQLIEDINNVEDNPFSGAVLFKNNGNTFEQGYGYANRSERIQNTVYTRFGIASGCKIFTAVAISQLVQSGAITFDTLLKDCVNIPFPNFDPNITIHQLLTHSSGIPDYFDEEIMDKFEELWKSTPMYSIQSPRDFFPMFQNNQMKYVPGEKFSYSNSGYILLGLIIEEVTGIDFTTYVESNIFQRCGMTYSGYFSMDRLPERTALGYIDSDSSWRTNVYSVPIKGGPDGGAFTTVHDLANFWDALFSNDLLSPEYTALLLTPHIKNTDHIYYGYGVWIQILNDKVFKYYVMGSDPGVSMQSSVYANQNSQAHIIGNTNKGTWKISGKIDELIFGSQEGAKINLKDFQ